MSASFELVTDLLSRWRRVDSRLLDKALSDAEEELQFIASELLTRNRDPRHPSTAVFLAHSSSPGLRGAPLETEDRGRFFEVATQSLRHTLVQAARRDRHLPIPAAVSPGTLDRVPLAAKILAVHHALESLQDIQPRQAKLLELLYFGRLTLSEAAEALGSNEASVQRDRRVAMRWLYARLSNPS